MSKPYNLSNETIRLLIIKGHLHKLDPNRMTRDHQVVALHYYGNHDDMHHMLKAKKLHHDAKFFIARYGNGEHLEALYKNHQPLDEKTKTQLRASVKLHRGDGEDYRAYDGLKIAQRIWHTVKDSVNDDS